MINWYIEENGAPKQVDMETWMAWEKANPIRVVKQTLLDGEKVQIITVFFLVPEIDLDFDHEKGTSTEIIYFYGTLVRGSAMNGHEHKYRSRKEAEDDHEKLVARVKALMAGEEVPECCQ